MHRAKLNDTLSLISNIKEMFNHPICSALFTNIQYMIGEI